MNIKDDHSLVSHPCKALTGCQHGFLPHRSSLSNLLIPEETIAWLMDDGNTAGVVNLDFVKAFD